MDFENQYLFLRNTEIKQKVEDSLSQYKLIKDGKSTMNMLQNEIKYILNHPLFTDKFNTFYSEGFETEEFDEEFINNWKQCVVNKWFNKLLVTIINISFDSDDEFRTSYIDYHLIDLNQKTLKNLIPLQNMLNALLILLNGSISEWCLKYHFFESPVYLDLFLFLLYDIFSKSTK